MSMIHTSNLKKYYGSEPNIVRALDGINLDINAGEFVAVVGTSGSGKSTLLHMLGGLDKPTEGKVMVDNQELSDMSHKDLTLFRRRNVGFVFQNFNLVPIFNVYENIVLPIELDGKTADKAFIDDIIAQLNLDHKRDALPNQLSGGQQQRVAIARALATKPSILLADEPTGNLDGKTTQDVLDIMKRTSEQLQQTIVMITHDMQIASLADRMVHIEDGNIVEDGGSYEKQ